MTYARVFIPHNQTPMLLAHVCDGLCWADLVGWQYADAKRRLAIRRQGSTGVYVMTHWDKKVPTGAWDICLA